MEARITIDLWEYNQMKIAYDLVNSIEDEHIAIRVYRGWGEYYLTKKELPELTQELIEDVKIHRELLKKCDQINTELHEKLNQNKISFFQKLFGS